MSMKEAECQQVARLIDAGKVVTTRWATETASGLMGFGSVSTAAGDPRFVVCKTRVPARHGEPSRLLPALVLDYDEALQNAKTSAGGGSGLGGYPHLLDMARAMLEVAPERDRTEWRAVVEAFVAADSKERKS